MEFEVSPPGFLLQFPLPGIILLDGPLPVLLPLAVYPCVLRVGLLAEQCSKFPLLLYTGQISSCGHLALVFADKIFLVCLRGRLLENSTE